MSDTQWCTGYQKVGSGSAPGITNSGSGRVRVLPYFLNPGIGYPRVIFGYQNHWKICQKRSFYFIFVNKFLKKVPNYLLFLFLLKQKHFKKKFMEFFLKNSHFLIKTTYIFRKILPLIAFQLPFGYPPGIKLGSGSVPGNS